MGLFARMFGVATLFALVALLLPTLTAQDKKDPKKDDPKAAKKDAKKDAKADPKKAGKDDKKKADPKSLPDEEKIVWGQVANAKLARMEANSNRQFAIRPVDQRKVFEFNQWKINQLISIKQSPTPQDYVSRLQSFNQALPGQAMTIYGKEVDVRGGEKMKVRTMFPPTKFDDTGNLVKWTAKELKELKGNSKLKGYPAEMDALKPGQLVEVYFAKVTPPSGGAKKKKTIDDELDALMMRPEVVLIVVTQEAPPR